MKYKNKKRTIGGVTFDSIMESEYYEYLLEQKDLGVIKDFELQPVYLLLPSFRKNGRTIRKTEYKADFLVTYQDLTQEVVDVKGMLTQAFKIKAKLFDYYYPHLELKLITKDKGQWIEVKNKKGRTPKKGGVRRGKRKKSLSL